MAESKVKLRSYDRVVKIINLIPRMVVYFFCITFFITNVANLIDQYKRYETIVMVQYKYPDHFQYPSFTICGCCMSQTVQNESWNSLLERELNLLERHTVNEMLENFSFPVNKLISHCGVVLDAQSKNQEIPCTAVVPVLSSIYNGRKCFTFLTKLISNGKWERIQLNDSYSAYIVIELSYPEPESPPWIADDYSLQNADTIIAIHPDWMIPTMLDTEFYRIDPENLYEIQFSKEVTLLKPQPYQTHCFNYDKKSKYPRSRNECVNMCILNASLDDPEINGVFLHNVISKYQLELLNVSDSARFNTSRDFMNYINFTIIRRECYDECKPDCLEETFKTNIDVSAISDDPPPPSSSKIFSERHKQRKSMVIIWPNRRQYQQVKHEEELNVFEVIGFLGGHAHIWLGISVITLYDMVTTKFWRIHFMFQLIIDRIKRRRCQKSEPVVISAIQISDRDQQ